MVDKKFTKRYVGFYLVEGFWADRKPDYTKFNSQYWLVPEFSKLMEERVIAESRGDRQIIIYRDGLITYGDDELDRTGMTVGKKTFQRIEKYTEITNALSAILISIITKEMGIKFHTHFEITHHDITGMTFENDEFIGMGIPSKSVIASQLQKRHLSMTPANCVDCLDLYIDSPPRAIVPKEVIELAVNTYFDATSQPENVRLLARANKAAAEFAGTSFSDCILISWLPIETHLYEKLRQYMDSEGSARFNRKRKDYVSKEFTVSEIIELLEFSKVISKDEHDKLHTVRKIRNSIVHDGYPATVEDASKALELLETIVNERTGKSVQLNAGISMQLF